MKIDFSSVKQKSILALLIMLVMISVIVTLVLCSPTETAYADSHTEDVTEVCRKYTNTISPNGIDFNQYRDDFISHTVNHTIIISGGTAGNLVKGSMHGAFSTCSGSNYIVTAKIEKDDNK